MTRARRIGLIVSKLTVVVLAVASTLWLQHQGRQWDKRLVASCANHFIQLHMSLRMVAHELPELVLPSTGDTRTALSIALSATNAPPDLSSWLHGYGSACPESFLRDARIGYVYAGDGLRAGDVLERGILILFCPAESHRRSQEHCHGLSQSGGDMCARSNAEMGKLIENAIARGESGDVNYSPRAMAVLREELARRRGARRSRKLSEPPANRR